MCVLYERRVLKGHIQQSKNPQSKNFDGIPELLFAQQRSGSWDKCATPFLNNAVTPFLRKRDSLKVKPLEDTPYPIQPTRLTGTPAV